MNNTLFARASVRVSSYLKKHSEIKNYVPGDETIDEYPRLSRKVRQEKTALKAALATTEGNKTEAAKLLE